MCELLATVFFFLGILGWVLFWIKEEQCHQLQGGRRRIERDEVVK